MVSPYIHHHFILEFFQACPHSFVFPPLSDKVFGVSQVIFPQVGLGWGACIESATDVENKAKLYIATDVFTWPETTHPDATRLPAVLAWQITLHVKCHQLNTYTCSMNSVQIKFKRNEMVCGLFHTCEYLDCLKSVLRPIKTPLLFRVSFILSSSNLSISTFCPVPVLQLFNSGH